MTPTINHEIHLAARPKGWPTPDDFRLVETPLPEPAQGEALVRNIYMSVDPYMRGLMDDVTSYYTLPFELGKVMQGAAIGRVVASRTDSLAEGDVVLSNNGWREYFVSGAGGLDFTAGERGMERIDPVAPLPAYLSVLGIPGMAAYVGLLDIGKPKEGETVFVSGAGGAVGAIAGQLARLKGCRVVGSAGSEAKVRYLIDELHFDGAFNYKEVDLDTALREHCPQGIDLYFDNVGGEQLRAAITALNPFGRITLCGTISQYNNTAPQPAPDNLRLLPDKRILLQGFIVSDHLGRWPEFVQEVSAYMADGRITRRETIADGIERAPQAFLDMLHGQNIGKMLVRLGPDDA